MEPVLPFISGYGQSIRLRGRIRVEFVGSFSGHFVPLPGNLVGIPLMESRAMAEPELVGMQPVEPSTKASILLAKFLEKHVVGHALVDLYLGVFETIRARHISNAKEDKEVSLLTWDIWRAGTCR
jgi:hypothetical protein